MSLLRNLSIDPTYYCNENCICCRCGNIAKQFKEENKLSLLEYYLLIDDFCEIGGKRISLYGGEPLLSPLTIDILKYSKDKGLITSLTTNGILLNNPKICRALIESNVDQIIVSIMGTDEKYADMHGVDYFHLFLSGLKRLVAFGEDIINKTNLHVTLQNLNYNQMPNIIMLAHEVGVKKVSCQYISVVSDENRDKTEALLGVTFDERICHWDLPRSLLLQKENVPDFVKSIKLAVKLSIENNICLNLDPVFNSCDLTETLSTGNFKPQGECLMDDVVVMPDGRIGACAMLQDFVIGNIKEKRLFTILKSRKYIELKEKVESGHFLPICLNCCRHAIFYNERHRCG